MKIKKLLIILSILTIFTSIGFSEEGHDFEIGLNLIKEGRPCTELSDIELYEIGEYYMEFMMPGEHHIYADQMMSGENSDSLNNVHKSFAYRFYCSNYGLEELSDEYYGYMGRYSGMYGMGYGMMGGMNKKYMLEQKGIYGDMSVMRGYDFYNTRVLIYSFIILAIGFLLGKYFSNLKYKN